MKVLFSGRSKKAWIAGVTTLLTALIAGNQDGVLTVTDYLVAALATVTSVGTVYGVRNRKELES